ncbi:MarR family winged helix-turn-helix transcriptional regulator [Sporolactobacillus kofuensis]|uniref:MarR family winged helix-turn-helix transcriptional regulator n=1 Tax=Sporolactobacillus kofuensis TaxID=269672 RepID=A0ABW1WGB4_9BACL|nr:MarR family transcriptional regulator [Sporolactobacillus kofuensis]
MKRDLVTSLISAYEELSLFTSNRVHEAVADIIKSHGITFEQLCLLRMLENNPGISPIQIAQLLDINKSGVSIRVHRLVDKGYIEKRMIDRRSFGLYNTVKGKRVFLEGEQKIHKLVGTWIEKLGEKDSKEFIRIYLKINEILSRQKAKR